MKPISLFAVLITVSFFGPAGVRAQGIIPYQIQGIVPQTTNAPTPVPVLQGATDVIGVTDTQLLCNFDGALFVNAIIASFETKDDKGSASVSNIAYDNQNRVTSYEYIDSSGNMQSIKNIGYYGGGIASYTASNSNVAMKISNITYDAQGQVKTYEYIDSSGNTHPVSNIVYRTDGLVTAYRTASDKFTVSISNIVYNKIGIIAYEYTDSALKTYRISNIVYGADGAIVSYTVAEGGQSCPKKLGAASPLFDDRASITTVSGITASRAKQDAAVTKPFDPIKGYLGKEDTRMPDASTAGDSQSREKTSTGVSDISPSNINTETELKSYVERTVNDDENIKEVEITDQKVRVIYKKPARIFGFIPAKIPYEVSVAYGDPGPPDSDRVSVKLPWWHIFTKKIAKVSEVAAALQSELEKAGLNPQPEPPKPADLVGLNPQPEPPMPAPETVFIKTKAVILTTLITSIKAK